jgi:hypothetical protein
MKNKLRLLSLVQIFKQNINCYFGGHDFDDQYTKCLNCGIILKKKEIKDNEK